MSMLLSSYFLVLSSYFAVTSVNTVNKFEQSKGSRKTSVAISVGLLVREVEQKVVQGQADESIDKETNLTIGPF